MRRCHACQTMKPVCDFYDTMISQSECKECFRKRIARRKRERRRFMLDYLAAHPCVDCGEADPVVLEFDHVLDGKTACISRMIGRSLAKLVAELELCEVRCANCHRRKTAREQGWYADQL